MRTWITLFTLLLALPAVRGATWPAASPAYTAVSNAVAMASNGDTVTIPSGTNTWTSTLLVTKWLSFVGAGTNSTRIIMNVDNSAHQSSDHAGLVLQGNGFNQVSGITFVGLGGYTAFPAITCWSGAAMRIHDSAFINCRQGVHTGGPFGVLDHNNFVNCRGAIQVFGQGNGQSSWLNYAPIAFTSTNYLFIENNTVTLDNGLAALYGDTSCAFVSAGQGASYVARYNTLNASGTAFISPAFDWHGDVDTDPSRGTISAQAYKNTLNLTGQATLNKLVDARGGQSLIYSNTISVVPGFQGYGIAVWEEHPLGTVVAGQVYYDYVTNQWQWANLTNGVGMSTFCETGASPAGCGMLDYHNSPYLGTYAQPYPHPLVTNVLANPGSVRLIFPAVSIREDQGPATITFVREGGFDGAVSASYTTTNGTALSGVNYTTTSGTVSWGNLDTANKTVDVPLTDTGMTTNRTFQMLMSAPTGGATLGSPAVMTVTLVGTAAGETFSWQDPPTASTNASGTLQLPVARGNGTAGTVTVDYATADISAQAGTDYTAASGTLSFPPGATITNVPITVTYAGVTTNRTFQVVLSNPTIGTSVISPSTNTVTIIGTGSVTNNGSISMSTNTVQLDEAIGSVTMTVRRSNGQDGAASVAFATTDGSALAGVNYTATNGVLSWLNGDSADKTVTIPIANTGLVGTRYFTFSLSNPTGNATLHSPTTETVQIVGSATQTISWQSNVSSAAASGTLTNTVTRTNGTAGAVSVDWFTRDGTALAGRDYTSSSGTLSLANLQSTGQIAVAISYQAAPTNRAFQIVLTNATGVNLAMPGTNTVTIVGTPPPIYTLLVAATNATSIPITVSPPDTNMVSGGTTAFVLHYTNQALVSLTAPATVSPTNQFAAWLVDGIIATTNTTALVALNTSHIVTAVYAYVPLAASTFALAIDSSPFSGVRISNSPGDIHGTYGGLTLLSEVFTNNTVVTLLAPTVPRYTFVRWQTNGVAATTNNFLTLPITANSTATAVYTQSKRPATIEVNNATFNNVTIAPQ